MDSRIRSETHRNQKIETLVHQMMKVDFASSHCSVAHSESKPAWDASGVLAPAGIDKNFVISAANILQTLLCLSNLTNADADDASKVREYAKLADEKLQALGELMRPMLWNLA
jgi:hypothetical protein